VAGRLCSLLRRFAQLARPHDDPLAVAGEDQGVGVRRRLRPRFGVEALDVFCRSSGQLLELALAQLDAGRALDRRLRFFVAAPGALDRGELAQAVGVDLLWQVERRVFQVEVLPLLGAVGEAGEPDRAEDRRERSFVAGLDDAMKLVGSVAHLVGTGLVDCAQVEVILIELAEELSAVYAETGLELGVGERRRFVASEEAHNSLIERVGGREGAPRLVLFSLQLRRCLLAISCFSPLSAAASSFSRAALKRLVAARTCATSSSLSITNFVLFLSE
jgi:hypothetical protein